MAGDILDVKRRLADRAQAAAEMLLPGGRREGQEWRAGSIDGERGKSLGVRLSGPKAGVWMDFEDPSKGGDLLDLWREVKRISLVEALDQARAWLGISRPAPYRDPKPAYVRPPKPACGSPSGRVNDYLIEERNIPGHILAAYKIGAHGDKIIFPFLLPDGTLALAKSREAVDGANPRPTSGELRAGTIRMAGGAAQRPRDHYHRGGDRCLVMGCLRPSRDVGAIRWREGRQAVVDRKRV